MGGVFGRAIEEVRAPVGDADTEHRTRRACRYKFDVTAMAARKLGGDRQTETRAVAARAAREGLEQMIERLFRQAWTIVGHVDMDMATFTACREAHLAEPRPGPPPHGHRRKRNSPPQ